MSRVTVLTRLHGAVAAVSATLSSELTELQTQAKENTITDLEAVLKRAQTLQTGIRTHVGSLAGVDAEITTLATVKIHAVDEVSGEPRYGAATVQKILGLQRRQGELREALEALEVPAGSLVVDLSARLQHQRQRVASVKAEAAHGSVFRAEQEERERLRREEEARAREAEAATALRAKAEEVRRAAEAGRAEALVRMQQLTAAVEGRIAAMNGQWAGDAGEVEGSAAEAAEARRRSMAARIDAAVVALRATSKDDWRRFSAALQFVGRLLEGIEGHPEDARRRTLRCDNRLLQEQLLGAGGGTAGLQCLLSVGFRVTGHRVLSALRQRMGGSGSKEGGDAAAASVTDASGATAVAASVTEKPDNPVPLSLPAELEAALTAEAWDIQQLLRAHVDSLGGVDGSVGAWQLELRPEPDPDRHMDAWCEWFDDLSFGKQRMEEAVVTAKQTK